ncbi:hypothetical protein ACHQM5_011365 [Ranunculus cassubicifolius]
MAAAAATRSIFSLTLFSTLSLLLLLCFPYPSSAASGGRMGGTSPPLSDDHYQYSSQSHLSSSSQHYESSPPIVDDASSGNGGGGSFQGLMIFLAFTGTIFGFVIFGNRTSVIKLQVCLCGGMVRSLQKDLDEIAQLADTSTNQGLNFVLKETILAVLRHPECIISAYSSVDVKRSFADGEKHFNQLSIKEREKFDDETHVNVNNIKRKKDSKLDPEFESNSRYIVITILVVVAGGQKLAPISSISGLKEVLQNLGSVSSKKIKAVEVLWTPQLENESISEEKLLDDYPFLRPLHDDTAESGPKIE